MTKFTLLISTGALLCASTSVSAFVANPVVSNSPSIATRLHDRINNKIELESPKVATMEKMAAGDKKVYCRCWLSGTFPLCDASHVAHNKETGDNVGPLIVSVEKAEE
ncbi:hypothetical protein ACHAXH_002439 [Discostella pseudostelligera]